MRISDWSSDVSSSDPQSKPGREDDPPNRAAPEAPSRYFPVIPRSIAMGATGGTPMARAVLTRTPEGLVVWRPIHRSQSNNSLRKPLRRPLCSRSEEHTSELQSLMRHSYAVFCLKK